MEFIGHIKNINDSKLNQINHIGVIRNESLISVVGFRGDTLNTPINITTLSCVSPTIYSIFEDDGIDQKIELANNVMKSPHMMDIDVKFDGDYGINTDFIKTAMTQVIMILMAQSGNVEYISYVDVKSADDDVQLNYIDVIMFKKDKFYAVVLNDSLQACESNNMLLSLVGYDVIKSESVSDFLVNGFDIGKW